MASVLLFLLIAIYTNLPSSSFAYSFDSFSFKSTTKNPNQAFKLPCNDHQTPQAKFEWGNLLLGLGGSYGPSLISNPPQACPNDQKPRKPLEPDFLKCDPNRDSHPWKRSRCPPIEASKQIIDFKFPPRPTHLRVRQPTHMLNEENIAKLKKGIELMRALPDEDPRSFKNQANVHSSYCDGLYPQVGFPDSRLKVHLGWLFFPFHRAYLYFFERILGDLIGDPSFAIPFWNWDSAVGMPMPHLYTFDPNSTLYNSRRDPRHLPPVFANFDYNHSTDPPNMNNDKLREQNYAILYKNVASVKSTTLFHGNSYAAGEEAEPGASMVEFEPHNTMHTWTGNHSHEDMGIYYAAARDPIFYTHHANIDRLWAIWKSLPGERKDYTDPVWLESSFLFYNEKQELVRMKIKDTLDTEKLGYRYETLPLPWLNKPQNTHKRANFKRGMRIRKFGAGVKMAKDVFPTRLNKAIKVLVPRPKKQKNEDEEEVMVVQGIELNAEVSIKFDVLVNYEFEEGGEHEYHAGETEFAGSFMNLAHEGDKGGEKLKTRLRLGISELLKDLEAEDEDYVQVTLVPRFENVDVFIGGIEIFIEGLSS